MLSNATWFKLCRSVCKLNKVVTPLVKCRKIWYVTRALRIVIKKKRQCYISANIVGCSSITLNRDDWEHLVKECKDEMTRFEMRQERRMMRSKKLELIKRKREERQRKNGELLNMIEKFENLTL